MSNIKLQGLRPKVSTVDEWFRTPGGCYRCPRTSLKLDIIIVAVFRGSITATIKMELDIRITPVSIWWYKLDKLEEIGDPKTWAKAQPGRQCLMKRISQKERRKLLQHEMISENGLVSRRGIFLYFKTLYKKRYYTNISYTFL